MGLFGALFAGVAGLSSQSNKIGIVSNNISNVNTVGYKQGAADFDTLVVPGSASGTFSPGGVLGNNQQLVDQQGLIQATTSNTDIAISGGGLFVVNTKADGTGDTEYTRSGSFAPDASGNFVNSAGLYLQGVPLSNSKSVTSLNANQLKTVSVNQNATGSSVATTSISFAGNLDATQTPLVGAGEVASLKSEDATNSSNAATDIIVPEGSSGNGLKAGDSFTITTGTSGVGNPTTDTYTYGNFGIGRNIVTGAVGQSGVPLANVGTALVTDNNTGPMTATDATHVTITVPTADAAAYVVGQKAYVTGVSGVVGPATNTQLNNQAYTITGNSTVAGVTTLTLALPNGATTTTGATGGGNAITITNRTYNFGGAATGQILDATTESGLLLGSSASDVTSASKGFSISVGGTNSATYNFNYNAVPDTTTGQFNSLDTLATAINSSSGGNLTASVKNNQLYISASNPDNSVSYTNNDATGSYASDGTYTPGINWVQELGLQNIPQNSPTTTGVHYFNSIQSLANQINATDPTNTEATVTNGTVSINAVDPQVTIEFADAASTTIGGTTPTTIAKQGGSILKALGFVKNDGTSLSAAGNIQDTGPISPVYVATDPTKNMSSGAVTPQFTKDVTVYDSLGVSHTIAMNVVKLSSLKWAVEMTAVPASDVISANAGATDGLIASGTLTFDGNGNLVTSTGFGFGSSTNSTTSTPITVQWAQTANSPGASSSIINFNLGDQGTTDGLGQFSGTSNITQATQNGSPTGQLTGVTIDENGFVTASFSNGQTQKLYQIPLASVNNPDGLESISGNAYKETLASGDVSLAYAGTNGVGTIAASALEQSNVDLSTQLTDLIVAQQAYGANTRVLTVTSQLLQELNQIIQ